MENQLDPIEEAALDMTDMDVDEGMLSIQNISEYYLKP